MTTCGKCGHAVFGRATKRGNHPACPRRKHKRGHKKAMRLLRHDADHRRAAVMGYKDPTSRVLPDGREILKGDDWIDRVVLLAIRAFQMCQGNLFIDGHGPHELIGGDPHHIIPRSKGRDDRLFNLAYVCREAHRLLDRRQVGGKRSAA